MNQVSRQSKFKAKMSEKIIHKSSLPNIDPVYSIPAKIKQIIPMNQHSKNCSKNDETQNQISDSSKGLRAYQTLNNTAKADQSEQAHNFHSILIKNNSIQIEKQLMTVDTVRPEQESNVNPKETSSRGFDMWSLNRNLKQFSQTRKIGFYKVKKDIIPSSSTGNSPYSIMNKTKTQQIHSMYKLYGGNAIKVTNPQRQKSQGRLKLKTFYDPVKKAVNKLMHKDAKSFSTISKKQALSPLGNTLYGTLPVRNKTPNLDLTFSKNPQNKTFSEPKFEHTESMKTHLNPYLRTFINGSHIKRQASNRNIHILEMNGFGKNVGENQEHLNVNKKLNNNFRRNRFQKLQPAQKSNQLNQVDVMADEEYSKSLDCTEQGLLVEQKNVNSFQQDRDFEEDFRSASSPTKGKFDPSKRAEQKKRQLQYNRSIDRINKFLLKSVDNYMDFNTFSTMPPSKIQIYIDSLNHPQFCNLPKQYKSTYHGDDQGQVGYDFSFIQPKPQAQRFTNNRTKRQQSSLGKVQKNVSGNK